MNNQDSHYERGTEGEQVSTYERIWLRALQTALDRSNWIKFGTSLNKPAPDLCLC